MISIQKAVESSINSRPLLHYLLNIGILNIRSIARLIKNDVEADTQKKVGVDAIALALHRQITKNATQQRTLNLLERQPDLKVIGTYHNLSALNFPKGQTGSEYIPDNTRYFVQTTGSNEHTIIISSEQASLLDKSKPLRRIDDLTAIIVSLPDNSYSTLAIYAKMFLAIAAAGVAVTEVVSTFNELTLVVPQNTYKKVIALLERL